MVGILRKAGFAIKCGQHNGTDMSTKAQRQQSAAVPYSDRYTVEDTRCFTVSALLSAIEAASPHLVGCRCFLSYCVTSLSRDL